MDIKLHILYDDRRIEKHPLLIDELAEQGIENYELFPAIIDMRSVVESINAGHKALVRMAKENKMPCIAIGEDDLQFSAPNAWKYFIDNMPKEFDLYLGGSYAKDVNPSTGEVKHLICGFHCYIVSERFYSEFLSVPDTAHIDTAMNDLNGDYHFCYPFPALQRSGFSANNPSAIVNYNSLLKEEDIYRG